jgi:hypothetical protein
LGSLLFSEKMASAPELNSETAGLIFHELIHAEQDQLGVRRAADQIGIGKTATAEQMDALRQRYPQYEELGISKDMRHRRVFDVFLNNILENRNGRPLSAEEAARADRLLDAHLEYPSILIDKETSDAMTKVREFSRLNSADIPFMLTLLDRQPEQYGFKQAPEQLQGLIVRAKLHYKLGMPYYQQLAREAVVRPEPLFGKDEEALIKEVMSKHYSALAKRLRERPEFPEETYHRYMDNELEREAYSGELLSRLSAQAQASTDQPRT